MTLHPAASPPPRFRRAALWLPLVVVLFGSASHPAGARGDDAFDRHTGKLLLTLVGTAEASPSLSLEQSARLKPLSSAVTSPCIVVKTDEGNVTKALVGWGLRKGPKEPTPVLLIERFVTYRADRPDLTTAHGKDVMLFPGFLFNCDLGQVVPEGQGGDLQFTTDRQLVALEPAVLYPLNGSALPAAEPQGGRPRNDDERITIEDYVGLWNVDADGRWKGTWELVVEDGRLKGSYTSLDSQNRYDIAGELGGASNNLRMEVYLANASMEVDGYLWTKGKSQMAGTVTLTGRKFGFTATRQLTAE